MKPRENTKRNWQTDKQTDKEWNRIRDRQVGIINYTDINGAYINTTIINNSYTEKAK